MKRFPNLRALFTLLLLGLSSGVAHADGGIIRLREAQGPFVVTIFTAAEPTQGSPVDLSVMVQKRDSSDAILDATVDLTLTPPAGAVAGLMEPFCGLPGGPGAGSVATVVTIPATREQASNKLVYAAPIQFGVVGNWRLQALVTCGKEAANVACDIPVGSPPRRLAGLLPFLAMPPLLVTQFAMNQRLRKQSLERMGVIWGGGQLDRRR